VHAAIEARTRMWDGILAALPAEPEEDGSLAVA
jgi:hypothetical protein